VASELSLASSLGASLLTRGGSAADAIISTILCVGVINSHHSGIGGGGFALVRTPDGDYHGIDCRVTAPVSVYGPLYYTCAV
jgi:gamma-glutamyltranspeptidase/glutathione hydrolase